MPGISSSDVLLAAAFGLVSERCRNAYAHDLKGDLQSLHSAVELLSRSAGASSADKPSMADRASSLAKRALAAHEAALDLYSRQTAPGPDASTDTDLGQLTAGVLQFLRHDALSKSVTLQSKLDSNVSLCTEANELRMLILGLCVTALDELPTQTVFEVRVQRDAQCACLRLTSKSLATARSPVIENWILSAGHPISSREFFLGVTSQWAQSRGGCMLFADDGMQATVSLRLPFSRNSNVES